MGGSLLERFPAWQVHNFTQAPFLVVCFLCFWLNPLLAELSQQGNLRPEREKSRLRQIRNPQLAAP
jgi:hypothetical protein